MQFAGCKRRHLHQWMRSVVAARSRTTINNLLLTLRLRWVDDRTVLLIFHYDNCSREWSLNYLCDAGEWASRCSRSQERDSVSENSDSFSIIKLEYCWKTWIDVDAADDNAISTAQHHTAFNNTRAHLHTYLLLCVLATGCARFHVHSLPNFCFLLVGNNEGSEKNVMLPNTIEKGYKSERQRSAAASNLRTKNHISAYLHTVTSVETSADCRQ